MKLLTPVKAIRAKCLDCSGHRPSKVRNCPVMDCVLFHYRMGHNPNRSGIGRKMGQISLKQASRDGGQEQDISKQG